MARVAVGGLLPHGRGIGATPRRGPTCRSAGRSHRHGAGPPHEAERSRGRDGERHRACTCLAESARGRRRRWVPIGRGARTGRADELGACPMGRGGRRAAGWWPPPSISIGRPAVPLRAASMTCSLGPGTHDAGGEQSEHATSRTPRRRAPAPSRRRCCGLRVATRTPPPRALAMGINGRSGRSRRRRAGAAATRSVDRAARGVMALAPVWPRAGVARRWRRYSTPSSVTRRCARQPTATALTSSGRRRCAPTTPHAPGPSG